MGIVVKFTALFAAFLLFQIELIAARKMLPGFGGGASVWTTCMVFFQIALLLGYGYALWLSSLNLKYQRWIHGTLLLVGGLSLIFSWLHWSAPLFGNVAVLAAGAHSPVSELLWALLLSIGLPFFILSSTSSLLQSWWAAKAESATNTYTLYSYSNAGSLLGLVSYPFLFEPTLSLTLQTTIWALGFLAYVAILIGLAAFLVSCQTSPLAKSGWRTEHETPVGAGVLAGRDPLRRWGQRLLQKSDSSREILKFFFWVGLAAIPSLLLLAVTTQLTVNVAPIPLLWMLPLALYLISFMICFSGAWRQNNELFGIVVVLVAIVCAIARSHETLLGLIGGTVIFCTGLLVVALYCHGLLYSLRPAAGQITRFYFAVSLGGVLGGMTAGIVAPLYFKDYWELPLALAMLTVLVAVIWWRSEAAWLRSWRLPLLVMAAMALMIEKQAASTTLSEDKGRQMQDEKAGQGGVIERQRNFYGVLQVLRNPCGPGVHVYSLMHGAISHGYQYDHPRLRLRPTSYYADMTGVGLVIKGLQEAETRQQGKAQGLRIGGLGMGIGTIAAYGREGDEIHFFEINPEVIRIATQASPFSYIRDSEAKVEIFEGDARLRLKRERQRVGALKYDLLVLDTFSGDSIPVHCLTEEAVALYLSCMEEGGVIAAHISNRYLDLAPVFAAIKRRFGLEGTIVITQGDRKISQDAAWVILTRNKAVLENPELKAVSRDEMETCKRIRLWTDDYSNLLDVLNLSKKIYALPSSSQQESTAAGVGVL